MPEQPDPMTRMHKMLIDIHRSVGRAIEIANGSPLTADEERMLRHA